MSAIDRLAKEIDKLRRRMDAAATPQLALSSVKLDDGTEMSVPEIGVTAKSAQTTADAAMESASGKGSVYHASAAPSDPPTSDYDVWFEYDESDNVVAMYKAAGGAWVPAALNHQVISSLDMGKATVGELVGARIAADALDGKTITGPTIRTAESGPRVVIEADPVIGGSSTPGSLVFQDDHPGLAGEGGLTDWPGQIRGYVDTIGTGYDMQTLDLRSGKLNAGTQATMGLRSSRSDGTGTMQNEGSTRAYMLADVIALYGSVLCDALRPQEVVGGSFSPSGNVTSERTDMGIVFTAPASGCVTVTASGFVRSDASSTAYLGWRLRTGGTPGSGSMVLDVATSRAFGNYGTSLVAGERSSLVTGLTPGATYNLRGVCVTSNGGAFSGPQLTLTPCT